MVAASLAPGLGQIAVTAFVFQQGLTGGAQLAVTGTAQPGNVQVLRAILRLFLV